MNIERAYSYSDIYLVPKKCVVGSRKECDVSVKLGKRTFVMPVYPSNMRSVVNQETCLYFAKKGWFYTMHRFGIDQVKFMDFMLSNDCFTSISLGVNEDSYAQVKEILSAKLSPNYITCDVANIWSQKGESMVKYLRDTFPDAFIIAGNLATGEAAVEVSRWNCSALKILIGTGNSCITRNKTAFHIPSASCIMEVYKTLKDNNIDIPIVADGGVKENGDIARAIACGASLIMAGSLFAGYDESAGEIIEVNGKLVKEYYGSASEWNKGEYKHVEGKKILIDYKGKIDKLLNELQEDLASSVSYAGGKDLYALKNVKIITDN